MASLSLRRIDDDVYRRLKMRANQHGISMEEEARRILSYSLIPTEKINTIFLRNFGPKNGVDLDILQQRVPHEPLDFNE